MLNLSGNKLLFDRSRMIRRFNPARLSRLSKFLHSKHGKRTCPAIPENPRKLSEKDFEAIKHALVDFVLRVSVDGERDRYTDEVEILPAVLNTLLDNFT